MADHSNKDALLDEISRRVIQLDSQRQYDEELHTTVQAYIEALDEITGIAKPDIEAIAQQVIDEYRQPLKPYKGYGVTPKHLLLGGTVLLATLLLMAIFAGKYFGLKEGIHVSEPVNNDGQVNNRALIIRSKLAQIFNQSASLKMAVLEHYQSTLKFPTDFKELGYNREDYEDGDLITHISFTADGGILFDLGKSFDSGAKLLLQSDAFKNKDVFHWACSTTIAQHYLGPVSSAPCQFSQTL